MSRLKKLASIFLTLALVLSVSVTAFATGNTEKFVAKYFEEGNDETYIEVTNVTAKKTIDLDLYENTESYTLYTAIAPVSITFCGTYITREDITFYPDAVYDNSGTITSFGDTYSSIDFKKSLSAYDNENDCQYCANGNNATLINPGVYEIYAAPSVMLPIPFYLIITGTLATPTSSAVLVNGNSKSFDAYTINENNYFKLRDLAYALNGTGKQFEVAWDGSKNAINLTSSKPYTAVGGEMAAGSKTSTAAALSTSTVYIDGVQKNLTAYTINGNNYFKLRDLGQAFNFGVTWNGTTNTVGIDTSTGYVSDTSTLSTTSNSSSSTDSSDYNDTQTPSVLPGGTTTNAGKISRGDPMSDADIAKGITEHGSINLE